MSLGVTTALLAALISVESGGNPRAVGDNGDAVGALQIHRAVVDDVNRIAGTRYTYSDRFDLEKSKAMAETYLEHYVTPKRLGRPVRDEDFARCWNGGPTGWKKKATDRYWAKVAKRLGPTIVDNNFKPSNKS